MTAFRARSSFSALLVAHNVRSRAAALVTASRSACSGSEEIRQFLGGLRTLSKSQSALSRSSMWTG